MNSYRKDSIYAEPVAEVSKFRFDEQVARVFPDMIERSVPGYGTIISTIGSLARHFAQADSFCYDLGCSLGAATLAMRHNITQSGCTIISVDNSAAMIERCRTIIADDYSAIPVDLKLTDITNLSIARASLVVVNFTLQFIPTERRLDLLRTIHAGLLPGGLLVLSEKLCINDSKQQRLHQQMHDAFKQYHGYSSLEISQKRDALENVLIPEALETQRERLDEAGFSSHEVWFQYFNFASLIAIK